MKRLLTTLLLAAAPTAIFAQEDTTTQQKPDTTQQKPNTTKENSKLPLIRPSNYASLIIDWGFNLLMDRPDNLDTNFLGSRGLNVHIYYNIRLGNSNFVISPGTGLGLEGYQFKKQEGKYYTLARNEKSRNTEIKNTEELLPKDVEVLQSRLNINYWDAMLEARFNLNRKYPKESFFIAIGGKLGMLFRAVTNVKYKEDDQNKRRKAVESFNLNRMRYGAYARIGWSRFGIFYTHTFSPLFNADKGPEDIDTYPYSIGLSLDLF